MTHETEERDNGVKRVRKAHRVEGNSQDSTDKEAQDLWSGDMNLSSSSIFIGESRLWLC